MAWSKPFTEVETLFVTQRWGQLSAAEIAEKLGRSRRGVENLAKRLGLSAPCARAIGADAEADAQPPPESLSAEAETQGEPGELEDLRWLRRQLKRQLADAGPQSAPRLASEFRETIAAIRRAEADDDGYGNEEQEEGQSVLASIFSSILPARGGQA